MQAIEKSSFNGMNRNSRLVDAIHLLSATLHLLDKLPEETKDLSIIDDIGALVQQAEAAIKETITMRPPVPFVPALAPATPENSIAA